MTDAKRASADDADPLLTLDPKPQIAHPSSSAQGFCLTERELRKAWQAVANAKLLEYRRQCWRLAMLVRTGVAERSAAVDRLWEIAIAHALVRALGEDRVQAILQEAFADVDFHPMRAGVA